MISIFKKTFFYLNLNQIFIYPALSLFCIFFALLIGFLPASRAKASTPSFEKNISTLAAGKQTTLSIKNLPKQGKVLFSSSRTGTASVEKYTGKLTAKKAGSVTIFAEIYKKNGMKIKTLKMKITILPKGFIENARFSLKQTINPYNYTIKLKSSRIILKKEIKDSKLSLMPKGKNAPKLSASFSKLSADGKEILYQLNSSSRKKLCPHDHSMDGTYIIRSNSFQKELTANYKERLDTEDISGFVLDIDGTPLDNAFVSYQTTEGDTTSYTDEAGHYEVKEKGAPVSLSVKKEGYQTETLNSLIISKKGTICENIILKSKTNFTEKKSSVETALDFHVKTEEEAPVPNAQVLLLPKSKITSGNNFLPKDILISEKTGTDGTLLISNSENPENGTYPYTHILSTTPASLSFLPSYTSSATKYATLPDAFTENEEYILYVYKDADTDSPAYEPCKLAFLPSSFYTDHLHFEILLKKCNMLDSSMLSINFETPEASDKPETVSFSFFKTGQKKAFYETSFKYTMNTKDSHPFSISRIPVSLLSGTYFLRISGMDEHRKLLYSSAVTKIIVKNGCISPAAITLHKKQYARLFACFSGDNLPESEVSFDLFQKTEENYFYLDTVSSSGFTKKFSDLYTADLSFSCLLPLETYLFQPTEAHFRSSSFLIAKISSENLYPTEDAALSASPFLQCSCIYTKNEKTEYPSDFSDHKIHILPEIDILITKEQIRTDSSYPNSVIAIYKKDGTPISTTLSPKLDKNTVFKESPDTIIDIYTNHELLMTNQSSYQ